MSQEQYGPLTFAQELTREALAHADAQEQAACDLYNACEDDLNDEGFFYQNRPDQASLARNPFIKGTPANDAS